ncbi:SCF ubiquitin ligase complex subunit GRR1 [Lachancea thermotolerans CBS 6340]|uniref:KLTH0F07546p n=1 Tax=Lachancea thermotolerans (strain ATCC 56472 / CBS 6340 / NRRL Y-8284) TaxID=559295 RepID=C5DKU2_LACTC|nr:KLTH0F07546p [Lachancea thermotolerans CBS 6340]CAR24093.1 KLTH0F07546p [Lachancea thermotolerans CBS 6340]
MSSGLPASWFTPQLPARGGTGHQERERLNQEHRERISRISQNEHALRDAFQLRGEEWANVPNPMASSRETHRFTTRTSDTPSVIGDGGATHGDLKAVSEGASSEEDVQMSGTEEALNARLIQKFEEQAQGKLNECIKVIEGRRDVLLHSFESDNTLLQQLQSGNREATDPDFISSINRLQRIRLRAIEMETLQLQRVKLYFKSRLSEFKVLVRNHMLAKANGEHTENPLKVCKNMFKDLNPHLASGMKLALASKNDEPGQVSLMSLKDRLPHALYQAPAASKKFPLRHLPSEILGLVLDRLSQKAEIVKLLSVCKSWAEIIVKLLYYRPHINKKSQLDLFMNTMRKPASETVFNYRAMIKRLNFSFVGDYMTDEQLILFVGCPNLERLTLVFCKHITSSSISAVLHGCKYLQSVDITGIKEVSDSIFNTLAFQCQRVQGFYVPQARDVSFAALHTFVTHAPLLKRVKITANVNMNDDLVSLLATLCPLLVEVDITSSPNVHDESLVRLFCQLTQLREFRITHNSNITDKLMKGLSQTVNHLPALRLVDLCDCENITDKSVELLVSLAPKLRNVFLGKCSRITDNSLVHLSRLGKNLQTIHFGHCFNLTDNGVRVLIQSCPRIQYVDFACCTNLTNRTLYELADLTKLKRIGLVKCSQMTDEGLLNMMALRGRNDTLERVHLSYCSNLTIYPIYELLMACPKLSHLSLTAVPSFLRSDITAFCRAAPSDFSENQRQIFCVFSGKGVHKLRHYLMSLTAPTNGPQSNVREVLTNFIVLKNLIKDGEDLEAGLRRVANELNQETPAILAATQSLTPLNALNNNDFAFQNINFERLDDVFFSLQRVPQDRILNEQDVDRLFPLIDEGFCEDPDSEQFAGRDGCVAPEASEDLNCELAQMVRKFHDLQERVCDFEVNVASMVRVQFQFAGALLNEMTHIYFQMVDLNRCISQIQTRVYDMGDEKNLKGLTIWRIIWQEKFEHMLEKYELTTVVLRLYLRDNVAALTRQRELFLARQRATLEASDRQERDPESPLPQTDIVAWNSDPDDRGNPWRRFEVPNEMRLIQFGLRGIPVPSNELPSVQTFFPNNIGPADTSPDEDEYLEDA